jgi:hypothetical protein
VSKLLQYHDLTLPSGINDTFDPESQANQTLRSAKNVDGYDVFRGVSKLPGSTKITSTAMPSTVQSIHQFEYTDLTATRQYKQLAASSGSLYNIVSGTPTAVWTSPALADEPLDAEAINSRLFLSSANQYALETGGVKFDGVNATRWGLLAPGQKATTLFAIDDVTGWSTSTDASMDDSTFSKHGDGSLEVTKTGGATINAQLTNNGGYPSQDLTSVGAGLVYTWVYVPNGGLQLLRSFESTGAASIELWACTGGAGKANVYKFYKGALVPGWNLLSFDPAAPNTTVGGGATLTDIDCIVVKLLTPSAGTLIPVPFRFDNWFYLEDGAPTATVDGAAANGVINETVSYRVTFLSEYGVESNGGTTSNSQSPSDATATGTITFAGGLPSDGNTVTIDTTVYTWRTTLTPLENEVLIGASATTARDNLEAAIKNDGNAGVAYATGTSAHPTVTATDSGTGIALSARTVGTAGNSIALAENDAQTGVSGATLTGGLDGQQIDLTGIPLSDDAQVIARRIYRDSNGDRIYRFVTQLDDNLTTTYTDNLASASLGAATMPIAGDDLLDSSPPPKLATFTLHDTRVFGIDGENSRIVHVSEPNRPEQFRLIDQITVDQDLVGLASHPLGLILYGRQEQQLPRHRGRQRAHHRLEGVGGSPHRRPARVLAHQRPAPRLVHRGHGGRPRRGLPCPRPLAHPRPVLRGLDHPRLPVRRPRHAVRHGRGARRHAQGLARRGMVGGHAPDRPDQRRADRADRGLPGPLGGRDRRSHLPRSGPGRDLLRRGRHDRRNRLRSGDPRRPAGARRERPGRAAPPPAQRRLHHRRHLHHHRHGPVRRGRRRDRLRQLGGDHRRRQDREDRPRPVHEGHRLLGSGARA